jgi:hypothetical protein
MLYASVMGTWGPGPFDNDAAADFIDELQRSSSRLVAETLRAIAGAPAGKYIEVDEGGAGWAACEMVDASSFQTGKYRPVPRCTVEACVSHGWTPIR